MGIVHRSAATLDELAAMGTVAPHDGTLPYESAKVRTATDRVDAVFIHKIWGLLIFAAIMGTLFVSIFWLAKPLMDGISGAIDWLGTAITSHMGV